VLIALGQVEFGAHPRSELQAGLELDGRLRIFAVGHPIVALLKEGIH